jgi:hypothetical protein
VTPSTCGEARQLLAAIKAGGTLSASPAWEELADKQAVSGTPDRPAITPVGEHVLRELSIRAYRCDAWPLDRLAEEEARILADLDATARNAEYFLQDLGPITPVPAVPYLRIVSAGLANRRESPEDLAERFRNVWGMVEVMAGDPRDQLLGVELLTASSATMSEVYAPMIATVEQLRAQGAARAIAAAAVLHLAGFPSGAQAVERWRAARALAPTDESAALLATVLANPAQKTAFEGFRAEFEKDRDVGGKLSAAIYLASQDATPAGTVDRVRRTAQLVAGRTRRPLLSAALLAAQHPLAPEELVDWIDKAAEIARARQLASHDAEFFALGLALIEGLPVHSFGGTGQAGEREPSALAAAATMLALHAWIYRPILEPAVGADSAPAVRAATP